MENLWGNPESDCFMPVSKFDLIGHKMIQDIYYIFLEDYDFYIKVNSPLN